MSLSGFGVGIMLAAWNELGSVPLLLQEILGNRYHFFLKHLVVFLTSPSWPGAYFFGKFIIDAISFINMIHIISPSCMDFGSSVSQARGQFHLIYQICGHSSQFIVSFY